MGKDTLEKVRSEQSEFFGDYEDPDRSDDQDEELDRLESPYIPKAGQKLKREAY